MICVKDFDPIYPNSINRIIIIDKIEYFLSYQYDRIDKYRLEDYPHDLEIGKLSLISKNSCKEGKPIRYFTNNILVKDSINNNLYNNDPLLIKKIIDILSGKKGFNESYKLEKESDKFIFKINLNPKVGFSIVVFTCVLDLNILNDYNEMIILLMKNFKSKLYHIRKTDETIEIYNKKSEFSIQKLNKLSKENEKEEDNLLNNMCLLLNKKKEEIRKLDYENDFVQELNEEENINSNMNNNINESELLNNSQALSLSDLL